MNFPWKDYAIAKNRKLIALQDVLFRALKECSDEKVYEILKEGIEK